MTGAPVPAGADAVCMIEETETAPDGGSVVIGRAAPTGRLRPPARPRRGHRRRDRPGGHRPHTRRTWACWPIRVRSVCACIPVRGSGCSPPATSSSRESGPLPPGKIRDANRRTLLALVRREGWDGIDLGIVGDDEAALVEVLSSAAIDVRRHPDQRRRERRRPRPGAGRAGETECREDALDAGRHPAGEAVRLRSPGRFGDAGLRAPGQPGVGHGQLRVVRPPGPSAPGRPSRPAPAHRLRHRRTSTCTGRPTASSTCLRAQLTLDDPASWRVRTTGGQESHQLHAMAEANALILLPDGAGVDAGEQVSVLLIDPDRLGADSSPVLRAPHQPTGGVVTTPVPVAISVSPRRSRPERDSRAGADHAARRTTGRPLREGPQRPPPFGDRSLQPPLRLLHARRGALLPPDRRTPDVRRDHPVGPGGQGPRRLRPPYHRRRAAGPQGPALAHRAALGARIRGPGHDHQRHRTGQGRPGVGGRRAATGQREL